MLCQFMLKEKKNIYAKNMKSKRNQNAFKYDCKSVSRKRGCYMMYLKGDYPHQTIMIVCRCI